MIFVIKWFFPLCPTLKQSASSSHLSQGSECRAAAGAEEASVCRNPLHTIKHKNFTSRLRKQLYFSLVLSGSRRKKINKRKGLKTGDRVGRFHLDKLTDVLVWIFFLIKKLDVLH